MLSLGAMMSFCLLPCTWLSLWVSSVLIWVSATHLSPWLLESNTVFKEGPVGLSLALLTLLVCLFLLQGSSIKACQNIDSYLLLILILTTFLVSAFLSPSLLVFYVFFEISVWPMLLILLGWGYQPERLKASQWMATYTIIGSLPLLAILLMVWSGPTSNMQACDFSSALLGLSVIGMMIKIPVYGVHLWLPLAHVEAPVGGSMVLAAILLKLGGFGLIILSPFIEKNCVVNQVLQIAALFGGVIISFLCIWQSDMKSLIAYSSVAHMSFILFVLLSHTHSGLYAGFILMVAHGISSSLMFALAYLLYLRTHTRSMCLLASHLSYSPKLTLILFLGCCLLMSAPPSLNFVSEVASAYSCASQSFSSMILITLMVFSAGAYSLLLFLSVSHGKTVKTMSEVSPTTREYLWVSTHVVMNLVLFMLVF